MPRSNPLAALLRALACVLLLIVPAGGFPRGGGSTGVSQYNYVMNLAAVTTPAIPLELVPYLGGWQTGNDGVNNYLTPSAALSPSSIAMPSNVAAAPITFTVQFNASSLPSLSAVTVSIDELPNGSAYQVQLNHDSAGASGALVVQKPNAGRNTYTNLAHIGTDGTTFTNGIKYAVITQATGTTTVTITVSVQRSSDNEYLTSSGTWSATSQNAVSATDSSSPLLTHGGTAIDVSASATDSVIYAFGVQHAVPAFTQYLGGINPVLARGSTYGGVVCNDANGPRLVQLTSGFGMAVQCWTTSGTQWHEMFFTSSAMTTWTYSSGSVLAPLSGNNLIGNGGMVKIGSTILMTQWNGVSSGGGGPNSVDIWTTTDQTFQAGNWTVGTKNITGSTTSFSPIPLVNPLTGNLECWYGDFSSGRNVYVTISTDGGTTWGTPTEQIPQPFGAQFDFAQVGGWYEADGTLTLLIDNAPATAGLTSTQMFRRPPGGAFAIGGFINTNRPANAWESVTVNATDALVADTGDGNGTVPRAVYAGQDNNSQTVNTDASVGLMTLIGGYPP